MTRPNAPGDRPNPRRKGYPRKRKPIPDDQIERDRILARKLHSLVYALPFLVLVGVLAWLWWSGQGPT